MLVRQGISSLRPLAIRVILIATLATLLAAKYVLPAPVHQLEPTVMNANFEKVLTAAGAQMVKAAMRNDRSDQRRFEFTLKDCPVPYIAMQASALEDLQAVINHAKALPEGFIPRVFFLGKELAFDDRLGLKLTAVKQFVAYRLGLSPEIPSGDIYLLLAKPGCDDYRVLEWWRVWAD